MTTRSRLVCVVDERDGYADRAREAAQAARGVGWEVVIVSLVSRGAPVTGTSGGWALTRVPLPPGLGPPEAVRRRARLDACAAVEARRRGLSPWDPRRLALATRLRWVRRRRRDAGRDDRAAATEDLLRRAATALAPAVAAADPQVVVAHGGTALAGAVAAARQVRADGRTVRVVHDAFAGGPALLHPPAVDSVVAVADPGWAEVLGAPSPSPVPASGAEVPRPSADVAAEVRLGVGPANFAGQGWAWARAAEAHLPGVRATSWALEQAVFNFPTDLRLSRPQAEQLDGQLAQVRRVLGLTHLLDESLRSVSGSLNGSVVAGDLPALKRAGVALAVLCHGTEIRSPERHLRLYPETSPFGDPAWDAVASIQAVASRNAAWLAAFDGPVFVSTPDLLDDVPWATWLPVVVDESDFAPGPPVLEREVPVVMHAPSSPRFKGTALVDPVLRGLEAEGLLRYARYTDLPPEQVASAIRDADVVIDHVVIGNYGVLACQAMAAGRVVVGHVHDRVRRRVPEEVPIVDATAGTLGDVLRGLLADPDGARATASRGPGFVRRVHDGRRSAEALAGFLGRR
ncbi:MAG: hypothetical protein MUC45_03285 [Actinomycetia bacterium]|jgi:hypothetical protein|nr:hypothetical protein [Actinomycetes bacterium]